MIPILPALENQHLTGNKVWCLERVSDECLIILCCPRNGVQEKDESTECIPEPPHVIGIQVVHSRRACEGNMQMLAL